MRRAITIAAVALALTVGLLEGRARASSFMWVVENQSDQVFTIDVTTLSATLVGSTGVDVFFGGLGFAQDGTLYAWNTGTGSLYTVNLTTGAFTLVGAGSVFGGDTFDINPVTEEAILWSVNGSLNDVNLATGGTTFRVNTSPSTLGIASAFGTSGIYYQLDRDSDQLNLVNINTGLVTTIGSLGVDLNATNLGFNPDDGMLYAIEIQDALYPLYRIDPATGAAVFVGNITGLPNDPSQQITMATFNVQQAVPEPATLLLLGSGLAAAAVRRRRNGKNARG